MFGPFKKRFVQLAKPLLDKDEKKNFDVKKMMKKQKLK
jgi:hypothetical protein